MNAAHYSVIRYIADPARNEPMNVGIVLWSEHGFVARIDDAALARVVRDNPHLERDALLYLPGYVDRRLRQTVPPFTRAGLLRLITEQSGFPVSLTEPRHTTITSPEGKSLSEAAERLLTRIVRPRRRSGGGGLRTAAVLQKDLKGLIAHQKITRHHTIQAAHTKLPRSVDFFANSGANVALDVVNFALARADDIRARADQEAFKIWDLLASDEIETYYVLCVFSRDATMRRTNESAQRIVTSTGGHITLNVDEARDILASAVDHEGRLFSGIEES